MPIVGEILGFVPVRVFVLMRNVLNIVSVALYVVISLECGRKAGYVGCCCFLKKVSLHMSDLAWGNQTVSLFVAKF